MGKGLASPSSLYAARSASAPFRRRSPPPPAGAKPLASPSTPAAAAAAAAKGMDDPVSEPREGRVPLAEVVSDCVRRWFQDTLKEARAGDSAMQVLVGQMYQSGYGVARNEQKAKSWISKAARYRSSAWKVCEKRPGYNVSDSDSEEVNDDLK